MLLLFVLHRCSFTVQVSAAWLIGDYSLLIACVYLTVATDMLAYTGALNRRVMELVNMHKMLQSECTSSKFGSTNVHEAAFKNCCSPLAPADFSLVPCSLRLNI